MAQDNSTETDTDTAQSTRYETPTFDPRGAFAWTLRSGEIARREQQDRVPGPSELASTEPDVADQIAKKMSRAECYEIPTFDPRGAFAWTLRSSEIGRLERRRRLSSADQRDVLAVAA